VCLQVGELVVNVNGTFFYTDHLDHQGGHIETDLIDIDRVRRQFEDAAVAMLPS
jgi:hypothetical protein